MDRLGVYYYYEGDDEKAIKWFQEAFKNHNIKDIYLDGY